ncbi:MAG: sigma-70 family RNA polymerase sigma factor [Actinomycetota bacterium]
MSIAGGRATTRTESRGKRMATTITHRTTTIDTAELLANAIAGDESAWNALFREFNPMIRSVVAGYRLDHATSADVCQTVWLRLYEHAERIRRPEALGGWLATTARNESLRCLRGQQRSRPSGVLEEEVDLTAPSPDERAIDDEMLTDVLTAFGKLPDDSQHLLRLLVASPPLPYRDIAARVGRPVGSIGPTRSRCLETLRSHLDQHGEAEVEADALPLAA